MELEQRSFRADPLLLKRLRIAAGLTVQKFQERTELKVDTARKLLRGEPVFLSTLAEAVQKAFQIENPLEVLHPEELARLGMRTEVAAAGQVLEWRIEEHLSGWRETSNGLQYQLLRLRHRFLEGRLARGKCYELRHLSTEEQNRVEAYLRRHVEVCERIGADPHIAANLTAARIDGLWWVLDRWEAGETLADRMRGGPLGDYELRFILTGIAQGLATLHRAKIIRRELSPGSVLLRESSDRPLLTDLELAKITGHVPTVSPEEWPEDPYRAPEVTGDAPLDIRADIYSWGRIFVEAASGELPPPGSETLPTAASIPLAVREVVLAAVERLPSRRPPDMRPVLRALRAWP